MTIKLGDKCRDTVTGFEEKRTMSDETLPAAVGARLEPGVGRLVPERADTCAQGCNGCDECTDYDDEPDDLCLHCHGDGMDPDCDYLLPCPDCGGSW